VATTWKISQRISSTTRLPSRGCESRKTAVQTWAHGPYFSPSTNTERKLPRGDGKDVFTVHRVVPARRYELPILKSIAFLVFPAVHEGPPRLDHDNSTPGLTKWLRGAVSNGLSALSVCSTYPGVVTRDYYNQAHLTGAFRRCLAVYPGACLGRGAGISMKTTSRRCQQISSRACPPWLICEYKILVYGSREAPNDGRLNFARCDTLPHARPFFWRRLYEIPLFPPASPLFGVRCELKPPWWNAWSVNIEEGGPLPIHFWGPALTRPRGFLRPFSAQTYTMVYSSIDFIALGPPTLAGIARLRERRPLTHFRRRYRLFHICRTTRDLDRNELDDAGVYADMFKGLTSLTILWVLCAASAAQRAVTSVLPPYNVQQEAIRDWRHRYLASVNCELPAWWSTHRRQPLSWTTCCWHELFWVNFRTSCESELGMGGLSVR